MWSLSSLRKLNSSSSIGINGGFKCISYVPSRFSSGSGYAYGGGYNDTDVNSKPQDNLESMNSQDNLRGPMSNTSSRDYFQGTLDAFRAVGGGRGMERNYNPQGNFRGPRTNFSSTGSMTYMSPQDYLGRPVPNVADKNILQESMNAILAGGDSRNSNTWRNRRSKDFIRGTLEQDRFAQRNMNQDRFAAQYIVKQDAHIVLMQLGRNNTHINVIDSKGDTKYWTASGNKNVGGGGKVGRYAAEATAEWVGRKVREMGVKSVVVRVKGLTYFKKKRLAIMSFKEGFSNSRSDAIKHIEDATRRPHNGCRLPKKRRI